MLSPRPLSIAICGTRGIPACYGGFETFAEELSTRLVARGHRVVVYGRRHVITHSQPTYRGVELRLLNAPRHKYFETPVHTFWSFLHLLRHRVDVVLVCNAANSPFLWVPRLASLPVAVNVDGVERKRAKWNALGRLWYRLGEWCSVKLADEVISDAEVIREYYRQTYGAESTVVRYGYRQGSSEHVENKLRGYFPTQGVLQTKIFSELGIEPGAYLLYVSRLEPENNAHVVIAAYNRLREKHAGIPLVIVGDAPYAAEYIASLRRAAGPGVHFAGYRFGSDYTALQLACTLYIQATEVGGTHPALVEAMGYGNCIVVNDTPENREVIGESGLAYQRNDSADLARIILELLMSPLRMSELRARAYERARKLFEWDAICSDYEQLFYRLDARRGNGRATPADATTSPVDDSESISSGPK